VVLALAERLSEANARVARLVQLRDYSAGPLADAAVDAAVLADALSAELQAMRRMPIEIVFNRFPRMIRELSHQLGKQVSLQVLGPELEVDRALAEELADLLVHLLRNAVDHGLEGPTERKEAGKGAVGTLQLAARCEGGSLILSVADDGRGSAPAKLRDTAVARGVLKANEAERLDDDAALQLIFDSGFTTTDVTTRISGRGVGLDAVKRKVETMGGRLSVDSTPGSGTIFQLRFPNTSAPPAQGPRPETRVGA
jgi:two-component system chemotaxis sensor kinase CheA